MKIFRKFGAVAILFCLPFTTFAWGANGHRISGEIANSYLNPKAKAAVQRILGNESVAIASNYADFIRSDPDFKYTENWHFLDMDKMNTLAEMKAFLTADTEVDAYTKLNFLIEELKKKNLPKKDQLFDLRMLIHIVEDVHQPMHTAHKDDQGGNDIKLNWFGKPTSLHTLWDSGLIENQLLSYTEYAAAINHTTAAQRAEWQSAPISAWFYENNQLADKIYSEVKPGDNLSYDYNFTHIAIVNQRLLKGGVRLAGLLNEIFGK